MNKKFKIYIFAISLIFIVVSCYTSSQSSAPKNKNLAYLYNPHAKTVHIKYSVHHTDDGNSKIVARINKNELFYVKSVVAEGQFSNIKIKYRIYNSFTSKQIVDSSSVIFNYKKYLLKDIFDIEIPIKIKKDSSYSAKIVFTDLNRERNETDYLFIDKKSRFSSQNFIVENIDSNILNLDNIIKSNINYKVNNPRVKQKEYFVSHYSDNFHAALLPFSTSKEETNFISDTIFKIDDILNVSEKGIYIVRADTNFNKGLSLLNFSTNYPELKNPQELFEPLRYITSSSEYKRLLNADSKKLAVDKFWLNLTGNKNRARELIKIYYSRVLLANQYFTSYKEGWKTDRGMIFVVFGAPTIVYKSDKFEKWIYGENQTNSGLIFLFEKESTFFPNADYKLHRNEVYKTTWYQAVDVWRNGRAFSIVY
jgi:GWxTD domain-containing protein